MPNPRPLVVRFGALGDMVILTVLIRHLHARFGQPVDVITSGAWAHPLLAHQPGVGNVFTIRSRNTPFLLSTSQWQLMRALRARGPSATWLADIRNDKAQWLLQQAGWNAEHWCHYDNLPDVPGPHLCDLFLRFAYRDPRVLGGRDLPLLATDAHGQLVVSESQRQDAAQWLTTMGLAERPLILVQAGNKRTMRSGFRQRSSNTKYWPETNWAKVLRGLRDLFADHAIVLLGAPQEAELNEEILMLANIEQTFNAARALPLPRLMALCERATAMVSVDTGPAHLAAAVGCPIVTLFGLASPHTYAPRGPLHHDPEQTLRRCLTGSLDGKPSMLGITPDAVLAAVQEHLVCQPRGLTARYPAP